MILNTVTERVYIGQSRKYKKRCQCHKNSLRRGDHHCYYLQQSWNKHGEAAFEFLVVDDNLEQEEADKFEKLLIQWFAELELAYNPAWRHKGRGEVSVETRILLSQQRRGIPTGRPMSDYVKQRLQEGLKAYYASYVKKPRKTYICQDCGGTVASSRALRCKTCDDKIKKQRCQGWQLPESARIASALLRTGRPLSEEHRAKVSSALKGRLPKNLSTLPELNQREVRLLDPNKNLVVRKGVALFCEEHGLVRQHVSRLLDGKIDQYRGWTRPENN